MLVRVAVQPPYRATVRVWLTRAFQRQVGPSPPALGCSLGWKGSLISGVSICQVFLTSWGHRGFKKES